MLNMARSMFKTKNMPHVYWGAAVTTAAYILNICPTKRLNGITPEEAWSGIKPTVSHLRIFGSLCYRHIPDEKRRKLSDKSQKLILVGYDPTGAYKLFDPVEQKCIISRDVIVDETATWNWDSTNASNGRRMTLIGNESEEEVSGLNMEETYINDGERLGGTGIETRPTRERRTSSRLTDYEVFPDSVITDDGDLVHLAFLAETEPIEHYDAVKDPKWMKAMKEELASIQKNDTWELVELPKGRKHIDVKGVFKLKKKPDGSVAKYKARLVVKGFLQKKGLDYGEVFSPVARKETIRTVLGIASLKEWNLHQMDVKSAFLNGFLKEEVYVSQPP
ncbi:unnamed protein product [Cuscuta europaea]|uniref:Reverse transcriptase Ty1/copia-type domain-containing protein n=1 Tax=Cuscuta europaea TaxID=41803 RepID=A0A9P0YTI2_CUSEU|nr:unnamed protein product [Cuscuta europaea]